MFNFAEATKDMTAVEILNYYRNLYYAEPQVTERGIVANAINDVLQMSIFLPCPIDHDSLFAIVDLYNRKKIVGRTIAKYNIDCIIIGFLGKPIYRCCNASNEWMDFDGDEIGKTIFLTREEAEATLKERNNHE